MGEEQKGEEQKEGKGFAVNDRRGFEADGTARQEPEEHSARGRPEHARDMDPEQLPEIDFSTFVLSLSTSAMVHLGEGPHPDGTRRKDLVLAKQTIDILGMLKRKTEGNLTDEEARLLGELLYDIRLRYVAATGSA